MLSHLEKKIYRQLFFFFFNVTRLEYIKLSDLSECLPVLCVLFEYVQRRGVIQSKVKSIKRFIIKYDEGECITYRLSLNTFPFLTISV